MIDMEKNAILGELKQQILYQGLSYERYLTTAGKTEEELLAGYDKPAMDRIKLRLALRDIGEQEDITVVHDEVEDKLKQQLERYPEDQRIVIKKNYVPGTDAYKSLKQQIKMQKTLEKILPRV